MRVNWKWRLAFALVGVALLSHAGLAAKIERFKDQEGTLHITNAGEAEPGKPGAPPGPNPATPQAQPRTFPQAAPPPPPAPNPPTPEQLAPPPPAPPPEASPDQEAEPPAEPPDEQSAVDGQENPDPGAAATQGQRVQPPGRIRAPGFPRGRGANPAAR